VTPAGRLRFAAAVAAGLAAVPWLNGCTTPPAPSEATAARPPRASYVVLLEDLDGKTGVLEITGPQGTTRLDRHLQTAALDGPAPRALELPAQQVEREFSEALAARVQPPEVFRLYFRTGAAALTPASERLLEEILGAARRRPAADVSIIGHTDTEGDTASNLRLGMERARWVANLLRGRGLAALEVTVASHGESNLLVPTADSVSEARNRRVEVIVR
jgi:outer membrane protein OmpA-like peptidoglycan-associated protein